MIRPLEWAPRARNELDALDSRTQERIRDAVHRLVDTGHGDVTKLGGHQAEWRLKVGPWRVRFTRHGSLYQILRVKRRREDTYKD